MVCLRRSNHPDHEVGRFDPAHLIPAQLIRREARTAPALADFVYLAEVAAWCCRDCHFTEDHSPDRVIDRDLLKARRDCWGEPLWPQLAALARRMDGLVRETPLPSSVAGDRKPQPFTAYIESRYPE